MAKRTVKKLTNQTLMQHREILLAKGDKY